MGRAKGREEQAIDAVWKRWLRKHGPPREDGDIPPLPWWVDQVRVLYPDAWPLRVRIDIEQRKIKRHLPTWAGFVDETPLAACSGYQASDQVEITHERPALGLAVDKLTIDLPPWTRMLIRPTRRKGFEHVLVRFLDGETYDERLQARELLRGAGKVPGAEVERWDDLRILFRAKFGGAQFVRSFGKTLDAAISRRLRASRQRKRAGLDADKKNADLRNWADWKRRAERIWRLDPDLKIKPTAEKIADEIADEVAGSEKKPPRWRTVREHISKPKK